MNQIRGTGIHGFLFRVLAQRVHPSFRVIVGAVVLASFCLHEAIQAEPWGGTFSVQSPTYKFKCPTGLVVMLGACQPRTRGKWASYERLKHYHQFLVSNVSPMPLAFLSLPLSLLLLPRLSFHCRPCRCALRHMLFTCARNVSLLPLSRQRNLAIKRRCAHARNDFRSST